MMEHRYRSIVKAISWRATGTLDTFVVSYIVTRRFTIALSICGVEVFTKMILYYFHERLWNRLNFGRKKLEPEYTI